MNKPKFLASIRLGYRLIEFLILIFLMPIIGRSSIINHPYKDVRFYSESFKAFRNYRIYLPKNYNEKAGVRYPVVYYFHGYGGRYKWDVYDVEDDINYDKNGRKEPPFVMEWEKYVDKNDLIIVTWDGYVPHTYPGTKEREGIRYGSKPYDYVRAHESDQQPWGWDFSVHFRELVKHVDKHFKTIADREHRGITGLSMGGLTAYYVAGQNKDLISSVSAFDPADNYPKYGPRGNQTVFPILQMYRSLKGLAVRLTITDGDWLKYNNWMVKQMFGAADLSHFESHVAIYPNHWAADIDKQLDFHMREFQKPRLLLDNWDYVDPGFPAFEVLGYKFQVQRKDPALTILKNISGRQMKILSRSFIPDGPIISNERIGVLTPAIYSPNELYELTSYNLVKEQFYSQNICATDEGSLSFELDGGGHIVGINNNHVAAVSPKLNMVFENNQEEFYFEEGILNNLSFKVVNVGNMEARNIEITASSLPPNMKINNNKVSIKNINPQSLVTLENRFAFYFTQYNDSCSIGSIYFEIKVDGRVVDTAKVMVFQTPKSISVSEKDVIILDGRSVGNIPIYKQGPNIITYESISGGEGNGNGKLDPGEKALIYIRLPQGMGPNDLNTFHRTCLINYSDDPFVYVEKLDYKEKLNQAGATSVGTVISLAAKTPNNHPLNLWLKVESLYNDKQDTTSRATVYGYKYDYARVRLASEIEH